MSAVSVVGCGATGGAFGLVKECSSPSAEAAWAPPADASSDPDWATLLLNPLDEFAVPDLSGCPAAATVATMTQFEDQARAQLRCVQDAWRPILEENGFDAEDISVTFYRGDRASTPCGDIDCPAVYCAVDGGGMWIGEASLDTATWFALGVKGVVNHEYAHHLQSVAGVLAAKERVGSSAESTRRVELQANCLAYAMIAHDDAVSEYLDLYSSSDPLLGSLIDDDVHGSSDSVAAWASTGLGAVTIGDCNTWLAAGETVS